MSSRRPASPTPRLRLGALALAAVLGACAADGLATGPRVADDATTSGGVEPAPATNGPACDQFLDVARAYASAAGLSRFCFTADYRPLVWYENAPAPGDAACACRGTAAPR